MFNPCRLGLSVMAASLVLALMPASAKDFDDSDDYVQTNLVSDLAGIAQLQECNFGEPMGHFFQFHQPVLDQ